jgi:asparagine synthase (glutamine-hydrolysing)
VAFSGGRDSSAVLAIATHVARRDGLSLPIPLTRVFPDAPAATEHEWQEKVVRHLALEDWQRITLTDELDAVGPRAHSHLLRHGVVWPPMIHVDGPLLDHLDGGSLLDGEGGDEVLGVDAHRIAPITSLVRSPRPVRRSRLRLAAAAVAPPSVRGRRMRRTAEGWPLDWLRPAARDELVETLVRTELQRPLSFRESVSVVPTRRSPATMARNRRALAAERDVVLTSPLLDPSVVGALARDGGVLGRGTRTAVLRSLVPDLLPDDVLRRPTKATFDEAYLGRHTVEFAERWSGQGLDDELVDPDVLRRIWLSDEPIALTAPLLQSAWLHDHTTWVPDHA